MSAPVLKNYFNGQWAEATGGDTIPVTNPATGEAIAHHPQSTRADLDAVVASAMAAFRDWRMTPVPTRASAMFRYRHLLTAATDELAAIITAENGKTLAEAKGELIRAIQYVEHAAAVTETMKGSVSEEIGTGVDIEYFHEPLGPFAIVAPFNFPAMIPLYFTWAVACGNPVIIKPSELCPLTTLRMVELAEEAGFPPGVVNVLMGDKTIVEGLADHPDVAGMSFVGSSEIARIVYERVSSHGKRCQAQGGAKNHLVVTDTAVLDRCMNNIVSSMYGNASQRCFAGSNLLVYASVYGEFLEKFTAKVNEYKLGDGTKEGVTLGPVISAAARDKFIAAVDAAEEAGAKVLIDGRKPDHDGAEGGFWLGPTLVEADTSSEFWTTELFGPVRSIAKVADLDEALDIINASTYGHTAVVYTELGGVAREFRQRVETGQVGVNVGTPAPIAFYPVGGRKSSFYGTLRGRANDAVDFYTDKKVVVTTWHADTGALTPDDPLFEGKV